MLKFIIRKCGLALLALMVASCSLDVVRNNQALAEYNNGDCKSAVSEWLPLAEKGLPAAQNNLGVIYGKGCPSAGIPRDDEQALHWYAISAGNGYPMGMRNMGWYYQNGLGVARNDAVATYLYTSAARLGNEQAKHDLEAMGEPVPSPDLLEQAQAEHAAKQQEIFNDVTAILLGAAIGVSASHHHTSPAVGGYHGAFTGAKPSGAFAPQNPMAITSGVVNRQTDTISVRKVGSTIYVTQPDGTTSGIIETIGDTSNGRDPRTGRTWTETKVGDTWSGQDSTGSTWTRRHVGDSEVITYSNGTTKTCHKVGDQLSCS